MVHHTATWDVGSVPDVVEWHTADPVELPLPNPRFLALHASAAIVADLSGASDYAQSLLDAQESCDMPVLAFDGSMADDLYIRLAQAAVTG